MSFYDKFAGNPDAEKNGIWVMIDEANNVEMKIAYMGTTNKQFLKAGEKRGRAFRKVKADVETLLSISKDVFVDACLKDWRGLPMRKENPNDPFKPLPFNRENAIKLMEDLPHLFDLLIALATDPATFSPDEPERDIEDEGKNS